MKNKIQKGLSYFSLFILALGMLPLGNILADEKVVPTKFVIEQNNLEANGFKIANDQVLTSEDVVKLSNVKSVDKLVDVNTLTVSDDQLANVNQANPDGGLYNLTLTNGQQATITIPVVKEGNLVTANSKGALIFKNLALSQEANNKEKVLEETGVYSVAFNNGYENKDLTVDFKEGIVTVSDNNLGLSNELSQGGYTREGGDTRSVPSTLSKSKAEARTNVSSGIAIAKATLESQMAVGEQINVTSFEQIKSRFATIKDNDNVVFNITSNINWSQGLALSSKNNVTITFVGKGGMINFTTSGIGINTQGGSNNTWNFKDITIKGVMEDRYATIAAAPPVAQQQWMFMYNQKNSEINLFGNTEMSNIYSPSRYGACFEVKDSNYSREGNVISGLQSINFYGGKYHHNRADVGSVVHTASSELNIFDADMYNNLNTWQGTIDQWEDTITTANFFGGTVRDGVTSYGGYAFSVIENPLSRNSDWTAVKTPDGDSIGGTKVYGGFSVKGSTQIDGNNNIIRNNANFSIHGWDGSVSSYVDKQSLNQAYFNPLMEMTPQSNVYIGCHANQNLDNSFLNYVNRDKYNKQVNGIILARLDYESNSPNKKYQGNGVAEGVHVDWTTNDPAHSNITSDGKYSVVEKYVRDLDSGPIDRSGYYAVLVRTYTDVEVQAVDANGISIENGKYNYTSTVAPNTQNKMSIPTINDKYPVSIELVSNTQTQGSDNSAHNPEITPANPDRNATEFTLKDNNNPSGTSGNVYKTVVRIKYNDVQHNSIDAHDAYARKSDVLSLSTNTIDTYIKQVMGVRVTNIDNGSVVGNENVQVSYVAGDKDKILSGIVGDYRITFNLDNVTVTKTLHVIEDGPSITPDNRGWVNAQNARITSQTAKVLNNENDLVGIINARGMYDGQEATISGTPKLSISTDRFSDIKLGKTDVYTVNAIVDGDGNFNTKDDQIVKEVKLTVFDPASVIPTPDGQGSITAQNTVLTASEAKQKVSNDDSLKDIMQARAEYNGNKDVDVKVNSNNQLSDIKAGKVNTNGYAITFSMDADNNPQTEMDNQVITKKLYVVPDGSGITLDKKGFISAEEIWFRSEDAKSAFVEDRFVFENMYGRANYDGQDYSYDGTTVATTTNLANVKSGVVGNHEVSFKLTINGQEAHVTKTLHIVENSYSVTADRFGYINASNPKTFDSESAIQTFGGQYPSMLKDTLGITAAYKGQDKTNDVAIEVPNWKDIQRGSPNKQGWIINLSLNGGVAGTVNDEINKTLYLPIIDKSDRATRATLFGLDDVQPIIGSMTENPNPNIIVDPDELPGYGAIAASAKAITVSEAKNIKEMADIGDIVQVGGHVDSNTFSSGTTQYLDPNNDAILDALHQGKTGVYVIWMYAPRENIPGHACAQAVELVVTGDNAKFETAGGKALPAYKRLAVAHLDPETTLKDIEVAGKGFNSIEDVAKAMNVISRAHIRQTTYFQKTDLQLEFVDINGNKLPDQAKPLEDIKNSVVGDYYVKVSTQSNEDYTTKPDGYQYPVTHASAIGKLSIVATDSTISAENFVVTTEEAKGLTQDQAKIKANVSAQRDGHDITSQVTANQDQLEAIKQAGTNGAVGVFPLTFEVNGVRKPIQVSVVNDDTAIDPTKSLFLHAVGFELPLDQAASLTADAAKTKANVKAWNKDGADLTPNVKANAAQLAKIQGATEPGAYPLVFTVTDNGKTVNKPVFVSLTDANTVCKGDVCITASNFKYEFDKKAELTDEKQIQEAHAKAWNKKTGDKEDITLTGSDAVRDAQKAGPYTVTATAKTASKPFIVSLYDANTIFDDNHFLRAENVSMLLADASGLTDQRIKDLAKVMAWEAQTGKDVTNDVAVNQTQLNAIKTATKPGAYPLTFTIGKVNKPIVVSLTDANTECNGNVCIAANNFTQNLTDVAQLDEAEAIKKAGATAWYKDSVDQKPTVKVNQEQLANIQKTNVAKEFPLTFTTVENPNVSKEVKVTVTDNNFELTANNYTIDLATAKNYTDTKLIENTKAKAVRKDNSGNGTVLVTSGLQAINQTTKAGLFPVTLSVKEDPNTTKQVFITVTDENTVVGDKAAITAKNFKLKLNTETASLTADIAKTKAEADAWYLDGHTPKPTINVDEAQLNAIKAANNVGVMDLTFTVADNTKATGTVARTVKVTIYDDNTEITPDKFLHAVGFELPLDQAASLTADAAKTKANVKAWNKDGADLTPNVKANAAQLAKIQGATEPGAYPLVFTVTDNGKTVNKPVFVSLTDANTVCKGDVCITASNFKYEFDKKAELTDEKQIQEAHAKAWNKKTGDKEDITLTGSDAVRDAQKAGPYTVTATAKTASKPFIVSLYDANTIFDDNHFLRAENVSMLLADASGLTDQRIKDLAKVMAWEAQTGKDVTNDVAVNQTQLNAIKTATKPGAYPLTFTIGKVNKPIVVSLTDANTECNGNVCIAANNFTQNLTDVAQLDEAEAIKKAGATAWYKDSVDQKPTVKVNQEQLANIQKTNVAKEFPLTFTTVENPNVSKEVKVTVTDNNFELTANNYTIDLATAKNYTDTKLIENTKAKAVRKDNSGNGTVLVTSGLQAINQTTKAGLFPVTLSVKEDPNTTKQVFITVTDENTVVGDKAAITAKNFKLKLNTETASLTADIAKTKAEADAWYLDGHTPKPTINVDEAQLNAIKAANNVGVMDLTFTVADNTKATGTVARTVKVTIYDDNTEITPDKFLHAKDFTITDEEAKALTESTAKDKAGVKAWNVDGTDLTPNVAVDPAQLAKIKEGVAGAYPLKFTVDGLEKTVNVTVTTNTIILPGLDNKPGTPDDVVVKPKPDQNGNYPKPNPDGSVTLPGGGEITIPGTGNGDITIAPPGSTIKPDGTITTPSGNEVRPNPEGGVELPGQDGSITNKPQDNPLVKPNGNGPITVNPDGSVTLPPNENGTITFPNNPDNNGVTNFPGGSTIKPDGTVITPNGNQVRPNPLGGVELPGIDGSITNKPQDNPVVKSEGNGPITINPDGSVTLPPNENGTVTFPNGNNNGVTNIPGGSTIKPDGTVVTPNGGEVRPNPEGGVELPGLDGSITNKPQDNPLVKPNGNGPITVNPDGSVTLPNDQNGTITFPNNPDNNNEITFPNGSNIGQNGQVTPPGGSPVLPNANGTITIPGADGNLGTPDDGIVTPNGNSTINPDGSLTLPGGGTVDLPGCQLTVEPGGVVLPNGAVINPGANGVLDTPGYAPQAPGTDNKTNTRAMANNEQANQGQQDATNQPNGNNTANSNVNDDVYLDPTIVCATPVVKPTTQPTAKPQTPTGAASQVVLYATIIAAAVGSIVVIRRNRK